MSQQAAGGTLDRGTRAVLRQRPKRSAITARGLLSLPVLVALALSSLVVVVAAPQPVTAAEVFTVTTVGDTSDTAAGDGLCTAAGGGCTLRAAIEEANALPGPDTIRFEIGGGAPFVIAPGSLLPAVTETVIIQGRNQAIGPDVNTPIRLDGVGAGPSATGLDLSGSTGSEVSGLSIGRFEVGILAGSNATIRGNFIGTDLAGAAGFGNGYGVRIQNASNVVVGGTTVGGADRNVIASNFVGVQITSNSDDNRILGNYIGTDPMGTAPLGNDFGISIQPFDASDTEPSERNLIGDGTGLGRNVISGNGREGIQLWDNAVGTVIRDNFIGVVGSVGQFPLGNNQSGPDTGAVGGVGGFNWGGIVLRNGASDNVIGGPGPGDANTIANNNNGVVAFSGTGNTITNNSMSANLDRGIVLFGAAVNDPGDLDGGANLGQNQPVLTSASIEAPNQLTVEFSVDTINPGSGVYPIVVDFYEADSGASGEGQRTLQGRFSIDDPGTYSTIIGFAGAQIELGDPIVAIATDAEGNSSTFSHVAVVGGGDALASSEADERFGASVALDGDRMAVSAPFADVAGVNGGVVRVYDRTDEAGPWVLTGVIATPNPEVDGGFGDALDLRGDLIAVGESDRFGDEGEAGVVWVFSFNGITWDPVGEAIEQPSPSAGDRFGTDLAWIDDTNLAIGAPGVAADSGSVFVATLTGGTWSSTDLSAPLPVGVQPAAGDEFGFSIAYDDSADGIGALIVGAPGSDNTDPARVDDGSIYRFERSGGSFNWTNRASGFGNDTRMGSSAAISGNRYVAGGFGTGNLQVVAREFDGAWQELPGGSFTGGVPTAGDGPVNDYLAIDGRTIAVGRGGSGGSVELFTIGDTWPSGPPTVIAPSEREAGDRIGWSLDLDGRTLLAGAPGDDGTSNAALDAGAVYSFDVPIVSTWTGASPAANNLWSDPQNWALGAVPEPGGAVIVPSGEVVDVDVDVELARFVMESGSFVGVGDERVFTSSDTTLLGSSELVAQPGGEIVLRNRAEIDSFFIARNGNFSELPNGVLTLDGDVVVTGTGEIDVPGTVRKTGAGTATVDVLDFPTPLSGWLSSSGSQIEVAEGVLELDGADLDNGELVGEVLVAAGAQFRVNGDVILTPSTSIGVEIDGNATTTDNYGRIDVTGTLDKAGELFVNETDLVVGNSYPVISCDDCLPGDFFSVPDGIDIQVDPQVISVAANPCDTEWTGAAGNGFWLTAANWTNGVPTAGDVACLNGTGDVTIGEDTSAAVDRFEIADQRIIVDGTLDVDNTSFMNAGAEVNGILTAIGDVVLRGDSVVSGFLDGLVSVENGATLELAGGASISATAPVNDFVNDGTVSVTATDLFFGDGVNVFNNGVWAWAADQPQRVVTSGTATFVNPAQIELSDQPVDLGPGISLEFGGGSVLATSIVSSSLAGQFGSLAAQGSVTVTPGAALIVELDPGYSPTIFDRYEILDCGADACDLFTNTTLPSGLEQSIVGGDIVVGLAAANPTFIDSTGDGLWGTAENWTTGLVPGANDIAEIPAGVTARVTGVFDVGAVDVDGQLDVGELDTLTITGGVEGDLVSSIRSGGSVTVVSPDTLNIAAASVVVESGGEFAIGTGARVVFNGTAPQTVTGVGEFRNEGTVRIENPSQVTIAETLDYFDGDDSSIEAAAGDFWFGPTNLGVTDVDIEAGASFDFTSTSAFAGGNFEVRGALDSDSLDVSGIVQVRTGGVFTPDGVLDVTGGQVFTSEAAPGGIVRLLDGSEITGIGLLANSGEISVTGTVTVGSGVDWNNGRNGLLDVDGALDVQTTQYEAEGSVDVAAGSTIAFAGNTILRPSSSLTFGVTSDGIAGTIDTQLLGFEPYGALDEDQSLATIVLDLDEGFSETGPITIIDCVNCAADPPGVANGVEFDEFVTGDYDVIVGRTTVDVAILDNKIVGPAPGEPFSSDSAFGAALAVDGDWAVVGAPTDASNFYVLRRVDGIGWEVAQSIETERFLDGSSVAIGGDHLAIGSPTGTDVYRLNGAGDAFESIAFLEGEVLDLDIDGDKLVVGSIDEDRVVTVLQLSPTLPPSVLGTIESPSIAVSGFAESVAVDDRDDGSSTVLVGARAGGDDESEVGVVYVYEAADADWITDPAPLVRLDAPEGGEEFGSSLGVSDGVVVVGDPFNDTPAGDQGAVWVYDETASFAAAPIKLLASDGTSSDTFGIAVDVDGGAIVAGAGAAQKSGFPLRDGAAYVFQFDGIDWVETDQLRAPDGFDQERFGDAVAVSGTNVLVGAPRDRNSNGFDAGAVYAFEFEAVEPAVNTFTGIGLLASWNDPTNWSSGFVPIEGEEAVVPAGFTATVLAGSTAVIGDLALEGTLDIDGTAWLGDAIISRTGNVDNSGTVLSNGASSIGPGLTWSNDVAAVVRAETGVLDIEDADFDTNGTLVIDAGARVLIQNDWTAQADSVLEFEIVGPSTSSDNYGQLELQSGTFTSAGTLRTIDNSVVPPTFDDVYPLIVCGTGSCESDPVSSFDTLDIDPLTSTTSAGVISVRGPEIPITLDFMLDLAPGAPSSLPVAPSGIAVNEIDRLAVARSGGGSSNVAASSITDIGPEDTSLASIQLGNTPIVDVIAESTELRAIPLVNIDIDGGWDRVIDGTDLISEPLSSLTLGQVIDSTESSDGVSPSPAAQLAATPLRSIDVDGTPLRSVPLAAIALGETPLRSIPLRSIDGDSTEPSTEPWCDIIGDLVSEFGDCAQALEELTVLEVTLRGVPLRSIPLRSIPLRSIDVADSPLRSILLTDISLGSTPLRSIPLRSIAVIDSPLRSIPLRSIPLRSIPASALDFDSVAAAPLRSIDLRTSPLRSITTSIAVEATPLRSIDAQGTPVSDIQVQGAPLRSIPISAVMLADVPLRSIELEEGGQALDWCDVLAASGGDFDCSSGVDLDTTTLSDLSVRGVPLRSIPLRSIPLRSILTGNLPVAVPLRSIPLRSIPLRSIPLGGISIEGTDVGSIDVGGTPLRSIPLRSIDVEGTAIGAIPLRSIAPGAIPLRSIPLRSIPLRSIPLRSIDIDTVSLAGTPLRSIPLRSIDVLGSPLRSIPLRSINPALVDCSALDCETETLGDAFTAGAISLDVEIGDLQDATAGVSLADLADALLDFDRETVLDGLDGLFLDPDLPLEGLTLADLPAGISELDEVLLGVLFEAVPVGSLGDLLDALVDPSTGLPYVGLEAEFEAVIVSLALQLGDLERLGDLTLDDLFEGDTSISLESLEPILRFISVQRLLDLAGVGVDADDVEFKSDDLGFENPLDLGQLSLADLSDLVFEAGEVPPTIGDLLTALGLTDLLDQFTLGDLLLALLDPGSLAYGGVEFADVDVSVLPASTVGSTRFAAAFSMTSAGPRTVDLDVQVPTSAGYVAGTGEISDADGAITPLEPTIVGDTLTWSFLAEPGVDYTLTFDVLPTLTLGSTSLAGTGTVVGTNVSIADAAAVSVVEGLEPNDFGDITETTPVVEDVVYLTYIPDSDDIDVFEITVEQDDELVVELSNLAADLDIVLWGDQDTSGGVALTNTSDEAPLFAVTDPDSDAVDAEPLDDFPRLDDVVPTLGVIELSNQLGTASETIRTGRLEAGTYYIQVYGANGASTPQPAALQVKVLEADERPVCVATDLPQFTGAASTAPSAAALAAADTLILLNERRLEQIYGVADRNAVRAAADRLVAAAAADPSLGITPVVVPVDAYGTVQQAYDNWDSAAGSCDPDAANAIVAAINDAIIDPIRDQLDHVTILGTDEIIPMARLADRTSIANEYDYRHEFDGDLAGADPNGRNAFTSTMWESSILSDEPYGDAAARSLGDRFLYVTDVALGRVVETPAEIVDALDTYVQFDGNLDINTATVLGYDFLADGSEAIADALDDTLPVDDQLALGPDPESPTPGDGWTADRATEKLQDIRDAASRALVSLNADFDHYRALPAIGDKVAGFDDNLIAQTVRDELGADSLARSLIFSMGCHSGLSVSDITIGQTNSDWAQTLGQQGSLYVGNTGFGYGDTETVAYTEQLMLLFAQQVTAPLEGADGTSTTVGQALAWAKNQFVAQLQTFSVYDEKAVQESTFYGLPFYRVGAPGDELPSIPAAPTTVTSPDATGTPSVQTTLETEITNDVNDGDRGRYYSNVDADGNELVIVAPGRPVQPKVIDDISVVDATGTALAEVARGAIVLDQTSEYVANADPVIATPVFDEALSQSEPELTSGVFPSKPTRITRSTGPGGERQQLVLATGQYDVESGVQRLDDDIDVIVYYAPTNGPGATDDFIAPRVRNVTSSLSDGSLTVSLTAGAVGSDVDRVYLLVAENPGVGAVVDWRGLDLARTPGTNRWTGSLALTPGTTNVEFIVQAKDLAGNVGYATNRSNFSQDDTPPLPPPPPPPPAELSVTAPTVPPSGWYTNAAVLTIEQAATSATVSVNGVQRPGTLEAGDTFTISDDGVQNWRVVTAAGRISVGTVRVDADGAPRVTLGVPVEAGTPTYVGGTRNVDVICRDTTLVDCNLTINGVNVANGDPLPTAPGTYTLRYTASDKVGNTTIGEADFNIVAPIVAPTITSSTIPSEPQAVGVPVAVAADFDDDTLATVTVEIDWGDGTEPEVVTPEPGAPGTISATRTYSEVGTYPVTITVTDAGGLFDSVFADVLVVDPAGVPVLETIDGPTEPQEITDTVTISATFSDASAPDDDFTATIDWGDGTQSEATVVAPTGPTAQGSVSADHVYAEVGVYPVSITVTDRANGFDTELFEFVVVFDPDTRARVSGAGTYWSGPEAYADTPRWGRPAFFGYNARYRNGRDVPSGTTRVKLLGEFNFRSTSYDYLIVNDAMAIAEGVGRIGSKEYRFRVQGIDNGRLDFFQITIWDPTSDEVLYDNGVLFEKGDVVLLGGIRVRGG